MVSPTNKRAKEAEKAVDERFLNIMKKPDELRKVLEKIKLAKANTAELFDCVNGSLVAHMQVVSNSATDTANAIGKLLGAAGGEEQVPHIHTMLLARAAQYYACLAIEAMLKKHKLID